MLWTAPHTASQCAKVVAVRNHLKGAPSDMNISTIGLDIAKNVFQFHGVDEPGVRSSPSAFLTSTNGTPRSCGSFATDTSTVVAPSTSVGPS
jgi:hypothetical protein